MSYASSIAVGVAFKPQYFEAVMHDLERVDFLEVHAENYLGAGGTPHRQLHALGSLKPLTVHGVGLSLGGFGAPDVQHLSRLRLLLERHPAKVFSEHLAWSRHDGVWLPGLLPLTYDDNTFDRVAAHIDAVQTALGRPVLLENPCTYLPLDDPRAEVDFLNALSRCTGCGLLLDINNAVVSCQNNAADARIYVQRIAAHAVAEIHLAGHSRQALEDGSELRIDDHGSAVSEYVLDLYANFIACAGPRPTLVEWDINLPEWPVLAAELTRVRAVARRALDQQLEA